MIFSYADRATQLARHQQLGEPQPDAEPTESACERIWRGCVAVARTTHAVRRTDAQFCTSVIYGRNTGRLRNRICHIHPSPCAAVEVTSTLHASAKPSNFAVCSRLRSSYELCTIELRSPLEVSSCGVALRLMRTDCGRARSTSPVI
jgi:hypothetical protein